MTQFVWMLHEYIAGITLAVLLLILLFMGILLQRINAVKKRLAKVTGQVEEYLRVILEDAADGQEAALTDRTEAAMASQASTGRAAAESATGRAAVESAAGRAAAEKTADLAAGKQAAKSAQNPLKRTASGEAPRCEEQEAQSQLISAVLEEIFP